MKIETEALKVEIEGLSEFLQTRRYSPDLKTRVMSWAQARRAEGCSVPAMCLEIGIGETTLRRFLDPANGPRTKAKPAGFRRVKVVEPVAAAVVVHGPGGTAVEGLSLDGVAELFQRLACSV